MLTPSHIKGGLPDFILVAELKGDDEDAYNALVIKHQDFSNNHAFTLTKDRGRALTLSTLAFRHIWRSRHMIPDEFMSCVAPPFWIYIAKVLHAYFDVLKDVDYDNPFGED
ncbi:hypothetical protein [Dinghuibacter silviterrae]|uniref:Uncharacterized protein n=1 Tax=Dinghuibacter silviterrae TaxID=1539049 RepID=A0A4V3GLQ6_9BACT|nr:hypothetical protein [Dinghuibacter silviterrae]TDX00483.1 hypothetical protein EDB95_1508 [Dinghuibacter silviterrae]